LAVRLEKSDGARAAVFLGPEEAALGELVRKAFSSSALVFDGLTLSQFASAAARLELFISNDTGPMHLAAAVGTPVLLLLGAPVPGPYWFGPVGEHHRMIARKSMAQIRPGRVRNRPEMMRNAAREALYQGAW
jgi:ADP-heptose:LPS heptosyltransferase